MIDISKCPRAVDISAFQLDIDWNLYAQWARQWDGVARVIMKVSEGRGFIDPSFHQHRAGALAAGIESIGYYHYGRPDLANVAWDEAAYFESVLGTIRPSDNIILDMEVDTSRAGVSLAKWADEWLHWQVTAYNRIPIIYSYPSYISTFLQRPGLANYRLWYAKWQDPTTAPPCPLPWESYETWQYTDTGVSIPGIPGVVDVDIFLIGGPMVPTGWMYDGTTLTANGYKVVAGFCDYILNHQWDPANVPLENEYGVDPVEDYFQQTPSGGTRQLFNFCELGWTSARGVYLVGIGNELRGCRNDRNNANLNLATAEKQVTQLQAELNATSQASVQKALADIKSAEGYLADASTALGG